MEKGQVRGLMEKGQVRGLMEKGQVRRLMENGIVWIYKAKYSKMEMLKKKIEGGTTWQSS